MRTLCILAFLLVTSALAGTVREYRDGAWKAIITAHPGPPYPGEARREGMQGQGRFRIYFGRDGRPTAVKVLESTGHQLLDDTAMNALRQWRGKPGPRRELDVPIAFTLSPFPVRPTPKQPPAVLREFSD